MTKVTIKETSYEDILKNKLYFSDLKHGEFFFYASDILPDGKYDEEYLKRKGKNDSITYLDPDSSSCDQVRDNGSMDTEVVRVKSLDVRFTV